MGFYDELILCDPIPERCPICGGRMNRVHDTHYCAYSNPTHYEIHDNGKSRCYYVLHATQNERNSHTFSNSTKNTALIFQLLQLRIQFSKKIFEEQLFQPKTNWLHDGF